MITDAVRFNPSASNPHPSHPRDARRKRTAPDCNKAGLKDKPRGDGQAACPVSSQQFPHPRRADASIARSRVSQQSHRAEGGRPRTPGARFRTTPQTDSHPRPGSTTKQRKAGRVHSKTLPLVLLAGPPLMNGLRDGSGNPDFTFHRNIPQATAPTDPKRGPTLPKTVNRREKENPKDGSAPDKSFSNPPTPRPPSLLDFRSRNRAMSLIHSVQQMPHIT